MKVKIDPGNIVTIDEELDRLRAEIKTLRGVVQDQEKEIEKLRAVVNKNDFNYTKVGSRR